MIQPEPEELEIAVRAWTTPATPKSRVRRDWIDPGPSEWSVTFDTETLTDMSEHLRIGSYQTRKASRLVEGGLFYEPTIVTSDELARLNAYTTRQGLRVLTRDEFVDDVLFRIAWKRRGRVIGFNLP
jgi:hypothetical protein